MPATSRAFFCLFAPRLLTFAKHVFIVSLMHSEHITTADLRLAYRRAGLWRIGMSFEQACAAPLVRWALEKSALAGRRSGKQRPVQLRLI